MSVTFDVEPFAGNVGRRFCLRAKRDFVTHRRIKRMEVDA